MNKNQAICIALDFDDENYALDQVKLLKSEAEYFKVGLQLYLNAGPAIIQKIKELGGKIFLDLKFHDIPNTVEKACKTVVKSGADIINIHASGGSMMIKAAREGILSGMEEAGLKNNPKLVAVTILTSIYPEMFEKEFGIQGDLKKTAITMAKLAMNAGCDGVVSSANEAAYIRETTHPDFFIITPGIRPTFGKQDDQIRVSTPDLALKNGSNLLVIGRPVTANDDPLHALIRIKEEIGE